MNSIEDGIEILKTTFIHFHQSLLKRTLELERAGIPKGLAGLFKRINYGDITEGFAALSHEASRMSEAVWEWNESFMYSDMYDPMFRLNSALKLFRNYADSMAAVSAALWSKSCGNRLSFGEYKEITATSERLRKELEESLPEMNQSFYNNFGIK